MDKTLYVDLTGDDVEPPSIDREWKTDTKHIRKSGHKEERPPIDRNRTEVFNKLSGILDDGHITEKVVKEGNDDH